MAEAKICDICNKFYKKPKVDEISHMKLFQPDGYAILQVDICPECAAVLNRMITNGIPKWLPEDQYDHVTFDWALVKLRDPGSGEISPLPYIAERRSDGEWYDRNDAKIIWPVAYFMDLSLLDQIFGGDDLK